MSNEQIKLNDFTLEILGKPNFWCGPIAHLMVAVGYAKINRKAEDEQAVVILWLLNLYLKHGENYKKEASKNLGEWQKKLENKEAKK